MVTAGIDMGSSTVKIAVLDGQKIIKLEVVDAASNPLETAERLLSNGADCPTVATGYGRDLLEIKHAFPTITEIKAHALGARFLLPDCSTVIDIGGQDLKIISLDKKGRVARFEMNDRCSAGTGKFLDVMARRLGYGLDVFGAAAMQGADGIVISAMCTVFAESEIIGLLNRGKNPKDIAYALHKSIAKRIESMFKRLDPVPGPVAVTGGGSRNNALSRILEQTLGMEICVHEHSQAAGALGCALYAKDIRN